MSLCLRVGGLLCFAILLVDRFLLRQCLMRYFPLVCRIVLATLWSLPVMVASSLLSINTLSFSSALLYSSLHLPTTTPISSKETDYPTKPADLTTPSLTRTTNSENYNIGADKNCKKKGQTKKVNADINKDIKGHGSLRPDRGRHDRVSHIHNTTPY